MNRDTRERLVICAVVVLMIVYGLTTMAALYILVMGARSEDIYDQSVIRTGSRA